MFKSTISDCNILKDSISTIGELIDEGIFKINKNGLSLLAADRAMVALVDFKMPATIFDEFNVDEEQNIGINISSLVSVLKRIKPKDKLSMEVKDNKLELTMKNGSTRRFVVPLLDISQDELPSTEKLDFKAKIKVNTDTLKNGIEDADIIGDSVVFEATNSKFGMKAAGDINSAELVLEKGNKQLLDLSVEGHIRSRYPLDYLKKIIKAGKIAKETSLKWSKDYPMQVGFKDIDKFEMNFILAPRVQED